MKKKRKLATLCFTVFITLLNFEIAFSQWLVQPGSGANRFAETDNNNSFINSVGVGNFSFNILSGSYTEPHAALDIVIPYLASNNGVWTPSGGDGEAIHSTAFKDFDHAWRMYEWEEKEKFHILNPSTSNDIHLNVVQRGFLELYTDNTHYGRLREQGFFGLSDYWSGGPFPNFTPLSMVHLNQINPSFPNPFVQFTNTNTGWGSITEGFKVGIELNQNYPGPSKTFAMLIQYENAPMKFYTNAIDRMIINANYNPTIHQVPVNTTGYVGIGLPNFWNEENGGEGPRSLLHLQGDYNAFNNGGHGWRSWCRTGIYINENSDEIYIGLKDEAAVNGTNRSDAVIMWGDDRFNIADQNGDNFRLIFSGMNLNGNGTGTNPLNIASRNGIETMRMTPFGRLGIGPLFTWNTPPARRLELLDYQQANGNSTNDPQLRLTFTQANANALNTTGIWTDFQTTSQGDLIINPRDGSTLKGVGINTSNPGNYLAIETPSSPNPGASGLRFHDLTTASIPVTSPWPANNRSVLSVDLNGDVILVRDETVAPTSGLLECSPTGIQNNFILRMENTATNEVCQSDIYNDYILHLVGISNTSPQQKLDVNGDINIPMANAYYINHSPFLKSSNGTDIELGFSAGPSTPHNSQWSIYIGNNAGASITETEAYNVFIGSSAGQNTVASSSSSADGERNVYVGAAAGSGSGIGHGSNNICIGTDAAGPLSHLNEFNYNIVLGSEAGNLPNDAGQNNVIIGHGSHVNNLGSGQIDNAIVIGNNLQTMSDNAFVCGNSTNQILMGYTTTPTTVSGGTYSSSDCRLYVNPRAGSSDAAYFNGNVILSGTVYQASDSVLKNNVATLSDSTASSLLQQMEPKSYQFIQNLNNNLNLPSGIQYGLIAEEIEQILPGLVKECTAPAIFDSVGNQIAADRTFKSINYTGIIPLLIASIKEQQNKIDSLIESDSLIQARIDNLEQLIINCCNGGTPASPRKVNPSMDIELSNSIILNQNDPNPFAEETRITFNIPENIVSAKIIFFDNSKHIIQTVKINERGEGQLNVYASNLTSGIYSYSLIADGVVVDTKKMVCTK